jgi:hypothetical protein
LALFIISLASNFREQEIADHVVWIGWKYSDSFGDSGEFADSFEFAGYCCIDDWRRSINESQVGRPGGSTPRISSPSGLAWGQQHLGFGSHSRPKAEVPRRNFMAMLVA